MKKKTKKRILIILSVLAFIYFIIITIVWVIVSKDIDTIDDSDLDLKKVNIAREENAYYDLMKIEDVIYYPTGDEGKFILGKDENEWNEKTVEKILLKNEEAFHYFDDASQKPFFQDPKWSTPENISRYTTISGLNIFRNMANLSDIKAKNLIKKGKNIEALEESFKIVSIGNKIKNSPQGHLIQYLIGISIESKGLKAITKIVKENKFTKEELIFYSDKLNEFSLNNEHLENIIKIEYKFMTDLIVPIDINRKEIAGEELSIFRLINMIMPFNDTDKFYYKPNKTKLLFVKQTRLNIQKVKNNINVCNNQSLEDIKVESSSGLASIFEENFKGKNIYNLSNFSNVVNSWNRKKCQEDFLLSAIRLQLLIEAYKNQHGSFPEKLEYLVPEYVEKIEFYPFKNDEIKYSADKKVIFYKSEDILNYKEEKDDNFYMKKNLIISLD